MIKRAMGLTVLAMATFIAVPAVAQAQMNPALIGEGALVWGNNCGRCHNIRPATERSDKEWLIILMHMRARANLTRHQADAVLAYLQATNTPEPAGSSADASQSRGAAQGDRGNPTQASRTRSSGGQELRRTADTRSRP